MTMPMARPRSLGCARSGAMGRAMWVTQASAPMTALARISNGKVGAAATQKRAMATAA